MLLDLINQDGYVSFSVKTAHVFGLNAAIYCSVLINILSKAIAKEKIDKEGYFKVDRKYITERTTLSELDQIKIENNLHKLGIVTKKEDNPDIIKFDDKAFSAVIANEDIEVMEDVAKKFKRGAVVKEAKTKAICKAVKDSMRCSNAELKAAMWKWVDSIFSKPNGYISKEAVEVFYNTMNEYTKGDLDLALSIVEIATINGYKDCKWAINVIERSKEYKLKKAQDAVKSITRVTKQEKITDSKDLSEIIF